MPGPEFEIELNSEVANFLNFFVCELIIMAYVIHATTTIAGAINFVHARDGQRLDLRPFDFPHLGGGLIMGRGNARMALVMLRAITLTAIAISSFGLEGRTRPKTRLQMVSLRRPGHVDVKDSIEFYRRVELYRRCVSTKNGTLEFGAVLDDTCYPKVKTGVVIKSLRLRSQQFLASATNCSRVEYTPYNIALFYCNNTDIVCKGIHSIERGRCSSVIYEENGAWSCPVQSARPEIMDEPVSCNFFELKRKDIRLWPEHSVLRPTDLEAAMFSAAYAVQERRRVEVPDGERAITIVTIFWMVPAAAQICVVLTVSIWGISLNLRGAARVANDERGLLAVLQQRIDLGTVRLAEWVRGDPSASHDKNLTPEKPDDV